MGPIAGYVYLTFGLVFFVAVALFFRATHLSTASLAIVLLLSGIHSILGIGGFYDKPETLTVRFPLLVMPSLAVAVALFFHRRGRAFIDSLDISTLTLLHVIRVGVEIVLLWLYTDKAIPQAMTFEGRNFDVLSGLSAPLVYYFGFVRPRLGRRVLIAWNVGCMLLLLNVVTNAFLSLPARFGHFGFEQPNIAVGFFPFLLLPAILVPLVLFSHAATLRKLIKQKH